MCFVPSLRWIKLQAICRNGKRKLGSEQTNNQLKSTNKATMCDMQKKSSCSNLLDALVALLFISFYGNYLSISLNWIKVNLITFPPRLSIDQFIISSMSGRFMVRCFTDLCFCHAINGMFIKVIKLCLYTAVACKCAHKYLDANVHAYTHTHVQM